MSQETDTSRMFEPRNVVDYLVDYYGVLGVGPSASAEEIAAAFRIQAQLYHPDKYDHLAPDLRRQAGRRMEVLNEANQILGDPIKRIEYNQTLSSWEGPISRDGRPTIDIHKANLRYVLTNPDEVERRIEQTFRQVQVSSGFSPTTFSFIERQYSSQANPDSELEEAYREVLSKKDLELALRESVLRELLGLDPQAATDTSPAANYLEAVKGDIEEGQTRWTQQIELTLSLLESGDLKLIGSSDESPTGEQPPQDLDVYRDQLLATYEIQSRRIEAIGAERAGVMERRLGLVRGIYLSELTSADKLIVGIGSEAARSWFAFNLSGNTAEGDEEISEELNGLDIEAIKSMSERGYSIMIVDHQEGLPLEEELTQATTRHFISYLSS